MNDWSNNFPKFLLLMHVKKSRFQVDKAFYNLTSLGQFLLPENQRLVECQLLLRHVS